MATLSDSSGYSTAQRKKKPITYGRPARNTTFTPQSVGSFFDQDKRDDRAVPHHIKAPTKLKPLPRRAPTRDEFDVPISDDDDDDVTGHDRDEYDVPVSDDERFPSKVRPVPTKTKGALSVRKSKQSPTQTTPIATRREQKRKSSGDMSARKRTRTSSPTSPLALETIHTIDNSSSSTNKAANVSAEKKKTPLPLQLPVVNGQNNNNNRRSSRTASRQTPMRPGLSAPARLNQMLSEDSLHESIQEDDSLPGTPPSTRPSLRRTLSTTPKQSQLWSQLLSSDPVDPTPRASEDRVLFVSESYPINSDRAAKSSDVKKLSSHTPRGTTERSYRLVDRLKQAEEPSDESDDDQDELTADELDDNKPRAAPVTVYTADTQTSPTSQTAHTQPQASESQASASASTKMTYAARTRSYLQEDTLEESLMLSLSLPTAPAVRPPAPARRGPQPSKGKPKPNFNTDSDSDDAGTGGIRSIHELRAAGNEKRFLDDNAALFDDIKHHDLASRSRRRSALMELASKLLDKNFLTRFVEHGFDRQLSGEFSIAYEDPISDFTLCAVIAQLADVDAADKALARLHRAGALDVAVRCLDESRSLIQVAKDRRTNMSKVAQSTFSEFTSTIRTSNLWGEAQPESLTLQLLGLKCMELIVLRLRRQGNKGSILGAHVVAKLVDLATKIDLSEGVTQSTSVQVITRKLALSVLEFASTSAALVDTWPMDLWEQIVAALPSMLQADEQSHSLILRLCINLTNNNAQNCHVCADDKAIEAIIQEIVDGFRHLHDDASDEQKSAARLDSLILSLGLMINLAEFSDGVCEQVVALQDSGLASIVAIFLRGQAKVEEAQSEAETKCNVAYGLLAVLLGNICQNETAREEVRGLLPDKKLLPLVDAIDEFAVHNRKVDSQAFEDEDGKDVWEHFTGRLVAVGKRLRQF